jgi:hypothetical protein
MRVWNLLRVNNGCGCRSSGTSAVPQTADDFGAPRKSAEMGQLRTLPSRRTMSPVAVVPVGTFSAVRFLFSIILTKIKTSHLRCS